MTPVVIEGVTFDWGADVDGAIGSDNWPLTWSDDDKQYTSWGDGIGFDGGTPTKSLGFSRITGPWGSQTYRDTFGASGAEALANVDGKCYGILAIGTTLYAFVSPGSESANMEKATLYKSVDSGNSWATVGVEFTNLAHGVAIPGFLQFGKGYASPRDGYVYAYWINVNVESFAIQAPGAICLTRVPIADIETQGAWEFFNGTAGAPSWTTAPENRTFVFEDADGIFISSCIYNYGLGRYILASPHTLLFGGNLMLHDAPEPWGPWHQIAKLSGFPSGAEIEQNSFYWNFSQKWMSADGRSFVMAIAGINNNDRFRAVPGTFLVS